MTPIAKPGSFAKQVPRVHLALAAAQFGIALLALTLDLAEACGSCSRDGRLHSWIGAAGAAAYAALFFLGWKNSWTAFYGGVFAAAGIHTALGIIMVLSGVFCPPCVAAVAVSLIFAALSIHTDGVPLGLAPGLYLPTLLVTLGALFPMVARARELEEERARAIGGFRAPAPSATGGLRIDVFEMDHCPYCVEFRQRFLPRLRSDFGGDLEVTFHDARRAPWVRRTPTVALEGGPVYEGLPHRYEDLREAVNERLRTRNP